MPELSLIIIGLKQCVTFQFFPYVMLPHDCWRLKLSHLLMLLFYNVKM